MARISRNPVSGLSKRARQRRRAIALRQAATRAADRVRARALSLDVCGRGMFPQQRLEVGEGGRDIGAGRVVVALDRHEDACRCLPAPRWPDSAASTSAGR